MGEFQELKNGGTALLTAEPEKKGNAWINELIRCSVFFALIVTGFDTYK